MVRATGVFADDALFAVALQPCRRGGDTLFANGTAHAHVGGAGSVGVEVLVHLVHQVVGAVGERFQVVVDAGPGPGARPGVAFDKNRLRCRSGCADAVDGSLVEVKDQGLVHVVIFIVGVEDLGRV